jgi:cell division inhibitor SepF
VPANDDSAVQPRPSTPRSAPTQRAAPAAVGADPYTVRPRRFDSAQEIADKFKEGLPVIMNLEAADREVSRRLIDFASGLCYGLNGTMEKVATGVYLLKPVARPSGYDESGYGA